MAVVALAVDAAFGWPVRLYRRIGHPVGGFARIIAFCETRWNRPVRTAGVRRMLGAVLVATIVAVALCFGFVIDWIARMSLGHWAWLALGLCAAPGLAQRSLYDHVTPVARNLGSGDLQAARRAVGAIVGRDIELLDGAGIARGAIESLAESFCDGVVAPLFWLLVGGLPGIWAYKAINTADSLIGHREERWRAFGWAAARADDIANLIPARIAGVMLCVAGAGGWRIMWRDAGRHASPNAGWPEAAMAGALGLRLAGPTTYDGVSLAKPWIGDGRSDAESTDIRRALALYLRACLCLWMIAGAVAWAR